MALNLYLQCLLGVQCKDFVMIAADQTNTLMSILVMRDDEDKLYEMTDKLVMGLNGDIGDRLQFSQLVSINLDLYKMKNKYNLGTSAVVHFTRKNMIDALQSGSPYIINVLMAGFDEDEGPKLYYLDFLGTCIQVPFATHGFGGLLSMGILENYYRPDLTEERAYEVLKLCAHEVHQRLFVNLPNFCVKKISQSGIKMMPAITPSSMFQ